MVQQLPVQELKKWQRENRRFLLVDVREDHEREAGHLGGEWIPMAEVLRQYQRIPTDVPVVFYCRKGIRSAIVIQRLQDKFGLSNLFNLEGGILAWQKAEHPDSTLASE